MFIWNDSFSLGIEDIDKQHQHLFEIGIQLHDLIERAEHEDCYDEIVSGINELKAYTVFHFLHEEKLLMESEFSDLQNHKEEHQSFVDYLDDIDLNMIDEQQQESLISMVKFLAKWIFKHIHESDMKYALELK